MGDDAYESDKLEYKASISKKATLIAASVVILVIAVIASCAFGNGYSFEYTVQVILDHITGVEYPRRSPEWLADYYIFNNVMPGVVMAVIAGAGLSLAGTVMQSVMENPLADAYTTGISSGAMLGAVTAIVMGFSFAGVSSGLGIITNAFVGSLIPAIVIILLIRRVGTSPATVILIGTALSFFFNSIVTLLLIGTSTSNLQTAYLWQIGSVADANWSEIPLMLVVVVIGSILVEISYKKLNVMSLGARTAKSLGLDVAQFRTFCIIIVSILVASIISFTGVIGFVGLVAPHIVRFLVGNDNKFVVLGSIFVGALTLTLADLASRLLYTVTEVPIGAVMSLIGAPIFLYLIVRKKSHREVFRCGREDRSSIAPGPTWGTRGTTTARSI